MKILAIETSCDDTGIAILEISKNGNQKLLADFVSSQIKTHAPWGGVVPMLAKREHQRNLAPLLKKALGKAKLLKNHKTQITNKNLKSKFSNLKSILDREPELTARLIPFLRKYKKPNIDYIAITVGPGLEPALWVGVNLARALSYIWNIPILPINHVEGHIAAAFASSESCGISKSQFLISKQIPSVKGRGPHGAFRPIPPLQKEEKIPPLNLRGGKGELFPIITLVVSGGHTQLILIKKPDQYKIVGETRDDAVGEAFDKVAKMLGLLYPGGPAIAKQASLWNNQFPISNFQKNSKSKFLNDQKILDSQIPPTPPLQKGGIINITLPRPMINSPDFDFSFSGLKTAVLYFIKNLSTKERKELVPAIAAQFQQAAIDVLNAKTIKAARHYKVKTILLGGGVAANDALRQTLKLAASNSNLNFLAAPKKFCADNASMIAFAAAQKIALNKKTKTASWKKLSAKANLIVGH